MTNTTVNATENKGFSFDGLLDGILNAANTAADIGMTVVNAGITVTEEVAALGIDIGTQVAEEVVVSTVVSSARTVVRTRNGYNSTKSRINENKDVQEVLSMFSGLFSSTTSVRRR